MKSEHQRRGFDLELFVPDWENEAQQQWTIPIAPRTAVSPDSTGTQIEISELHDDVKRRISDELFVSDLSTRIAQTYSFFIGRVVNISVNGSLINSVLQELGENYSSDSFAVEGVSCSTLCGLSKAINGEHTDEASGWFVFCNGRTVVCADKTTLTGWGSAGYLPLFQPKHRPFCGLIFFVAADPELLPWTTTKASINQESLVWQESKRRMATTARPIIKVLDQRYVDGADRVESDPLLQFTRHVSALDAAAGPARTFQPPPRAPKPKEVSIQYSVLVSDTDKIRSHLSRRSMSNREVGKFTFLYFLENEVGK